ncbi:hypothetical protein RDI58_007246 [Solanum bulbocastanum]|uniref:Uncharacterized protein n=1 Tax=Solanum bulbocastanum TaxID=147425 RepID=A0AAN8TZZ7_SOLBU
MSSIKNAALVIFLVDENKKIHPQLSIGFKEVLFRPKDNNEQCTGQMCSGNGPNNETKSKFPVMDNAEIPLSLYFPMNQPTSFIMWNTHGANNDNFKRNF